MKLVGEAARALGPSADIEIIERHHRTKKDAPSGTALAAGGVRRAGHRRRAGSSRASRASPGVRQPGEIGIHALRIADCPGEHHVVFSLMGETLELSHRALNRDGFARGASTPRSFSPASRRACTPWRMCSPDATRAQEPGPQAAGRTEHRWPLANGVICAPSAAARSRRSPIPTSICDMSWARSRADHSTACPSGIFAAIRRWRQFIVADGFAPVIVVGRAVRQARSSTRGSWLDEERAGDRAATCGSGNCRRRIVDLGLSAAKA